MAAETVRSIALREAHRQDVDPWLVLRVAQAESNMDPSVPNSSAGAIGPMQLMPDTARGLGVNPYNLEENIRGGVTYLKQMQTTFPGDRAKQLAGYNAGPGAVKKYGGVPPYPETQNYVRKILGWLGPRSAEAAGPTPQRQPSANTEADPLFDDLLTHQDAPGSAPGATPPHGAAPEAASDPLFDDLLNAPSGLATPVLPLPPTPSAVRNPLAPEQRARVEAATAVHALSPDGEPQTVGAAAVTLPGQTGLPEERSTRNPLAPDAVNTPPAMSPDLLAQGYGTLDEAIQTGQLLPWLTGRLTQPTVWRQAADTGARVVGGLLTGGASLPVQMGTQMATEAAAQAVGLQPPSLGAVATAGATEAAGNMAAPVALKAFQGVLRLSRGAKQLLHSLRMQEIQTAARLAREPLEQAQQSGSALASEADLQSRELRTLRPGMARGMDRQLVQKNAQLDDMLTRTQGAIRGRLGRLGSDQAELLLRRIGHFGPEVSEDAVSAAYRQLDDVQRLSVQSGAVRETLHSIHPSVREGLREVLSVIPDNPSMLTFADLRRIQTSLGKNIRSLERSIARNMDDMNGPVRLDALKKLYASTFQALDDTMASRQAFVWKPQVDGPPQLTRTRFPPETKRLLEEANTLNRVVSTMDRMETLWGTKAISVVGGQEIFDADKLLRAIRSDAFLVRMLHKDGLYEGLSRTLAKIAQAQRQKFPMAGATTSGVQAMNQRLSRAEALRDITRQRTSAQLQSETQQGLGQIAQYEREAGARAAVQVPPQQAVSLTSDIARPLLAGATVTGLTGNLGAGASVGTAIASVEGIGRWLLSKQGQRALERLFARDPLLTAPKVGFLLNASASTEPETPTAPPMPE